MRREDTPFDPKINETSLLIRGAKKTALLKEDGSTVWKPRFIDGLFP